MKKIIIVLFIYCSNTGIITAQEKDRIIYGTCTKDSLLQAPFQKWFNTYYSNYNPDFETIQKIKSKKLDLISVQLFFGSWCGDSKREVPRFYKVLDAIGIKEQNISLIAVGGSDSLYKQSPGKEEKGLGIFRVPVMIIYRNGKEINRINEYPSISLEKDFLSIINNENYVPNYASFPILNIWFTNGDLTDINADADGMANQINKLVRNDSELNSLGNLLNKQHFQKEALQVLKINHSLYPNSVNVLRSLGEAFLQHKENEKGIRYLELALKENKEPAQFTSLLDLLYKAKGIK